MNSLGPRAYRRLLAWQASVALFVGLKPIARRLYEQMAELDPGDELALSGLGHLRMEAGDSSGAASALAELVERHPLNADAWFNLGFVHEKRGDLLPAERCMREAVRLNPRLDRAWYGLALVLIRNGELQDAIPVLEKNIALQPMSPYGYYQLGMTLHHLGRTDEARRIVNHLGTFEPKYAATLDRDIDRTTPHIPPKNGPSAFPDPDAGAQPRALHGST